MDWDAWAHRAASALDHRQGGGGEAWRELFAAGGVFSDPVTTTPTTDLHSIHVQTTRVFPDWWQEITSIRGGDAWATFEWVGRGTFSPPKGSPVPVELHGVTIIEVDIEGLVTTWRDYLDRKEPEEQIIRGMSPSPPKGGTPDRRSSVDDR